MASIERPTQVPMSKAPCAIAPEAHGRSAAETYAKDKILHAESRKSNPTCGRVVNVFHNLEVPPIMGRREAPTFWHPPRNYLPPLPAIPLVPF